MNIALVVHDLHTHGGHALYTRVLADAFAARHRVTVFANTCERPSDALWQHTPVWAMRQKAVISIASFPWGLRSHRQALRDFDIVHSQGYCGALHGITTAHMCVAAFRSAIQSPTWVNRASFELLETLERRFYKQFRGEIIAVSARTARDLREHYDVRQPIHVVHHGVDSERFTPALRATARQPVRARHGLSDEQFVALYVGDITKAHRGLKALAARCPQVTLLVVTASTRYAWQAHNVIFAPHSRQVEAYYAAADCFVFPTVNDPFGLVVLEAMASGLPVLCSDQAGASELITHGQNGFVYPLETWVDAAADVLSRPERFAHWGNNARDAARSRTWAVVADATERLYSKVR